MRKQRDVAVISSKPPRLEQIKEAVNAALGTDKTARVGYYTPDDFLVWLNNLAKTEPLLVSTEPSVTVRRGRTVTRKTAALTPEERRVKEAAQHKLIAEVMLKK